MSSKNIFIAGGGTGGHVYPGLALAEAWQAAGYTVHWFGVEGNIEERIIPQQNPSIKLHLMKKQQAWRQVHFLSRLLGLMSVYKATQQALSILNEEGAACFMGMGGYVSVPAGLAAWWGRVPVLIHESNARAGLANRILSYLSDQVYVTHPHAFSSRRFGWQPKHQRLMQTPLSTLMLDQAKEKRRITQHRDPSSQTLRLLVVGGSQGAKAINQAVIQALKIWGQVEESKALQLSCWLITGPKSFEDTKALTEELTCDLQIIASDASLDHVDADVPPVVGQAYSLDKKSKLILQPYCQSMFKAYQWADLVLCRSGAMSLAEVEAFGLPALLVPYPHAADQHQWHNAKALVEGGAALRWSQDAYLSYRLAQFLKLIALGHPQFEHMIQSSLNRPFPCYCAQHVSLLEELLSKDPSASVS